jgi:cellulose biosynthesis protein BcsQ
MVITFYSYKGGVGRTLALANIACLLAEDPDHPQRVLLWDFDLEAPGLHKLFAPPTPRKHGFVDLAYQFARSGVLPDVADYIYESQVKGVDVLPAGDVSEDYRSKLQEIDWAGFFSDEPRDQGPFFVPLLDAICQKLEYDYVLVDSRTGLNDQAGICTVVLPDLLIIIFRLTDQNLDGIERLVPSIRGEFDRRKRPQIPIVPLVSPIASAASQVVSARRDRASHVFEGAELNYIRFDADLINEEALLCPQDTREKRWPVPAIIDDYERLCRVIRSYNDKDTRRATERLRSSLRAADYLTAASLLSPLLHRRPRLPVLWETLETLNAEKAINDKDSQVLVDAIASEDPGNFYCYEWKAGLCLQSAESPESSQLGEAKQYLEKAIELDPKRETPFSILAAVNSCRGDLEGAVSALRRWRSLVPTNAQNIIELARIHMRMGANYFATAADELEEASQVRLETVLPDLALLRGYLGEKEKAREAFECYMKSPNADQQHLRLLEAHLKVVSGQPGEGMKVANEAIPSAQDEGDRSALSNWAEFFLCVEDYERALAIAATTLPQYPMAFPECRALAALIKFLKGYDCEETKVLEAWWGWYWDFAELLLFRERVSRTSKDSEFVSRLGVFEKLIRQQELNLHRRGTRVASAYTRRSKRARKR